jgi:hypothetical protein
VWGGWIWLTKPESELLRPLAAGSLAVEMVVCGPASALPSARRISIAAGTAADTVPTARLLALCGSATQRVKPLL